MDKVFECIFFFITVKDHHWTNVDYNDGPTFGQYMICQHCTNIGPAVKTMLAQYSRPSMDQLAYNIGP